MKNISLPVFFILLLFAGCAWALNKYLQRFIKPRESLARLLLYILSGFVLVFASVFVAVRVVLWLFPPAIK